MNDLLDPPPPEGDDERALVTELGRLSNKARNALESVFSCQHHGNAIGEARAQERLRSSLSERHRINEQLRSLRRAMTDA